MVPTNMQHVTASMENAKPYKFEFPLATTALLIIDIQRDFVDPDGFGAIQCGNPEIFSKARAIVPAVRHLLDLFRSFNGHVIHTREGHQADLADLPASKALRQVSSPNGHHTMGIGGQGPMGRLLVRGEYGHDIVEELTPWPGETVIDKPGKGSFWGTDIHRILLAKGITHIIITGVTTECCVSSTLRECNDRGFQCCVLEDCTQGFDAQQVTTALDTICGQDGLFGFVGSKGDFITAFEAAVKQVPVPSSESIFQDDLMLPPIADLLLAYKTRQITPLQMVEFVYAKIERYQLLDSAVWISLEPKEKCLEAAAKLADDYADKPLPPLFGIPFSVKDTIDVAGHQTTAACEPYAFTPTTNAPAVQHVLDAGGIFIGKTNLDQLATGLSGCRSPWGIPRSVFDKKYISGGSSSGSAVSVGAGLVSFGLATDTAGSGRVPAAFNGIVGFKPTKGTVSARGLVPAIRTLDTITVVSRHVSDARHVWQIIARHDAQDLYAKLPRTLPTWHVDFRGPRMGGFTFAIPPQSAIDICKGPYRKLFHQAVAIIEEHNGRQREVNYTIFQDANELLYNGALLFERIHCIGEEFLVANLSALHETTSALFTAALDAPPRQSKIFEDQARQIELTRRAEQVFDVLNGGIDVLVVPTVALHPSVEEMLANPLQLNAELGAFTHFANVVDLCAVNIRAGTYREEGTVLPFGITLLGGSGRDAKILDIAATIERACHGLLLEG